MLHLGSSSFNTFPVAATGNQCPADLRISDGNKRTAAERVIDERLGSAMLTVANLCRWTGMSRSSLYRLFDVDGGVQSYIRNQRLARVATELRGPTTLRMVELAERWGFCDAAYLARVFREVYGMTPSAYRASHTG